MSRCARLVTTLLLIWFSQFSFAQPSAPNSWVYSTYFGGSLSDGISAIARDAAGNVYVTGTASSPDFPTTQGVYEPVFPGPSGATAIFVAKFSATGALVWSTFVGPGAYQWSIASTIRVDARQNVYVAGIFQDPGFPNTAGLPDDGSVFAFKLNAKATRLLFSTRLGGNSVLSTPKLVLDSLGDTFFTGGGDLCCNGATGMIGPGGGIADFWVAEVNAAGNAIPWSVAIGGSDDDETYDMTIDSANQLYLTGYTGSLDFPSTPGALYQPSAGSSFVVKLNPSLAPSSSLVYSAVVGSPKGNSNPFMEAFGIALDAADNAYVGNWTYDVGLITSKWAFQRVAPVTPNVYVFKLNPGGSAILGGTYLGGSNADYAWPIAADSRGTIYVGGATDSWDFPTTAYGPAQGAYYVALNSQFAAVSSVGLPAWGVSGLVPDGNGGLWAAGTVANTQPFPVTSNAYQATNRGQSNGFLLHTNLAPLCATATAAFCGISSDPRNSERIHFVAQSARPQSAGSIALSVDGMRVYTSHAAQLDTWIPVAPGTHTGTVLAQQVSGKVYQQNRSFAVSASATCPLNPIVPSLTFCSPLNAAVVQGSVQIQIVANDQHPPTAVRLYLDGHFVATVQGQRGTYSYNAQVGAGVHHLLAQFNDAYGNFLYATVAFRSN